MRAFGSQMVAVGQMVAVKLPMVAVVCPDIAEMIELNIEPQIIVYYDKLDINRKIPNQHRSTIQVS